MRNNMISLTYSFFIKYVILIFLTFIFIFYFSNIFNIFLINLISSKTNQPKFDLSKIRLITAFSGDHFEEALKSCMSIRSLEETKNWKPGYVIAYLLKNDIPEQKINEYKNACPFVSLKVFNFSLYPDFVQYLYDYRWKPLIIEKALQEFESVFYFDSSVLFNNNATETLEEIFTKIQLSKCGMRLFSSSIHSIYAATHPRMLQFFNFSENLAKENTMHAATYLIANKNSLNIVKKWYRCALEKECMAPTESRRACDIEKFSKNEYANCHRFDQSALAIFLYQCSFFSSDYLQPSSLFSIKRLGAPPP